MKYFGIGLLMLGLCFSHLCPAMAGTDNTGTALKSDVIRDEPFRDAKTVGSLVRGDTVEILTKDGGWFRVKSARGKGWVRMLTVRRAESAKTEYSAKGLLALVSGRAGTGKVIATTGIRGLNEDDLKSAHFDLEQVLLLESFGVSKNQARQFAAKGRLRARTMYYLPRESTR